MKFYVNNLAQNSGDHEVHDENCRYLPAITSKTLLGDFSSCSEAVKVAKKTYSKADGCVTCSPTCNNG